MEQKFEKLWKDRTPIDSEMDALGKEGRLNWSLLLSEEECNENPPNRLRRPIVNPLPKPRTPPTTTAGAEKEDELSLNACQTVGDVYSQLTKLAMPPRTLSLLRNRATFLLLLLNNNPSQVQARFSVTLYHTLYNEFLGHVESEGNFDRQRYLLQRVYLLQDYLQQGIPEVARFLSEYLIQWDGQEHFADLANLLCYVEISDFKDLYDGLLSHFVCHFDTVMSPGQRLIFLSSIHKLIHHWIATEYEMCRNNRKRIFGVGSSNCIHPLRAIADLLELFRRHLELGLLLTLETPRNKNGMKDFYMREALFMCTAISRALLRKSLPLRLEIPPTLVYHALFGHTHPCHMNSALEHISMIKHESLPLCHTFKFDAEQKAASSEGDDLVLLDELAYVSKHLLDKEAINSVTKDVLAVLCRDMVYLDRGLSIFREHWQLEDESIRPNLSLTSNVAFFHVSMTFLDKYATENEVSRAEVYRDLTEELSPVYDQYVTALSAHFPRITDFMETFRSKKKSYAESKAASSKSSQGTKTSTATSGISSMQPSKRNLRPSGSPGMALRKKTRKNQ